jgi:activator of HSP90 ATPase
MMKFTMTTIINASAKEIYSTWLDSEGHSKMTGGTATISDKEGNEFSAWDSYISGKNIKLEPYSRIVQSWRTTLFKNTDPDSNVELIFKELEGETEITLVHSNLAEDGEHYKQGWEDYYFKPMKAYFSKTTS